jgi:hypothetical protein
MVVDPSKNKDKITLLEDVEMTTPKPIDRLSFFYDEPVAEREQETQEVACHTHSLPLSLPLCVRLQTWTRFLMNEPSEHPRPENNAQLLWSSSPQRCGCLLPQRPPEPSKEVKRETSRALDILERILSRPRVDALPPDEEDDDEEGSYE